MQEAEGTTYAMEYPLMYKPGAKQEPYYPLLTEASQQAARQYQACAAEVRGLYTCGRLADFKYYNMDQALRRALEVAKQIVFS